MSTESKVVEAVGTAVTRKAENGNNPVQNAMRNAVIDIYREADDIWARSDIDADEKRRLISKILSDDNIRMRTLAARAEFRASVRDGFK